MDAPMRRPVPLSRWRSDASAERGPGGVVRLPLLGLTMLLTIKDLSAWLNIKPSTLYLWAAQGKIPCQKIHGLIRFDRKKSRDGSGPFSREAGKRSGQLTV